MLNGARDFDALDREQSQLILRDLRVRFVLLSIFKAFRGFGLRN
jgi:hypothetical protein